MDRARRAAPSAAPQDAAFLRSSAASLLSGVVTVALGRAAHGLLTGTPRTLDNVVGGAVLGIGAAAAAMLAVGCLLLAVAAVRRFAGLTSRRLEALAAHLTPLVVRRALAVTISAGLGLGVAAGPAAATEPDTGWAVTTTATSSTSVAGGASTAIPPAAEPVSHGVVDVPAATVGPALDTSAPTAPVPTGSRGPDLSGAWAPTVQAAADHGTQPRAAGTSAEPAAETAESRPEVTEASGVGGRTTSDEPVGTPAAATPDSGSPGPAPTPEVEAGEPEADPGPPVHHATTPASPTTAGLAPAPAPTTAPAPVTVVAGDTLWSIAAAHLPASATAWDVARAWPEWYALNEAAIGSDPGLIRPGQTLEAPASAQSGEEQA